MELFSLLAKLTLDKSDFDKGVSDAESEARGMNIGTPELGLNKGEFDEGIEEAQGEIVEDQEPKLGLNKGEFDTNIKAAEESGGQFGETLKSVFNEIGGLLITGGIVGGISKIVSTLKEGIELAKNTGDAIDKQSQKMNISAEAYQKWSYALNLSGASIDDLNRGLRTWQQAVGDEDATKKLGEAFKSLGMNADEAIKQLESGEKLDSLLDQVMYALADYNGSDRGAIAEALFGKGSTGLNALFNATSKEIRDMKQEAEDLGLVMTDEEVKNAAAYMDATTRLQQSIEALKIAFVRDIIPYLTDASNTLANIVAMFNPRNEKPTLVKQIEEIDKSLATNVTNLERNKKKAESLLEKLEALGDYNSLDDEGKKTWEALANELIRLFPELDKVIDKDTHVIKTNTDEIKKNIDEWTKLEEKRLLDQNLADKREAIAKQYTAALNKEIEAELKETDAAGLRSEAIEQLNAALKKEGMEQLDSNASYQDFLIARSKLANKYAGTPSGQLKFEEYRTLGSEYESVMKEAEGLRIEADKLTEEADKATDDYTKYAEKLAEKLGITIEETESATAAAKDYKEELSNIPTDVYTTFHQAYDDRGYQHSYAIGSSYIPYDQLAYVHRGEEIRTATDVRRDKGNGIDYGKLEDRIAEAIRVGMADAQVTAVVTDRQVAMGSNRYNGNELDSRRFVP